MNFHPYVTNIDNVEVHGSCGVQAIAVSLGYSQNYWRQILLEFCNELLENWGRYAMIFYDDINNVHHSLSFTRLSYAQNKHDPSTCFLLWHGLQDISHHRSIVIAFVYNGHYVKVNLQESHQMPTVLSLWCHHRSERSAR
uniref:Uncharacterized protein n=1 Tax=Lactuca sativa TaxID=4236 RepID=A0A9R1VGC8_LACSA|nr:hypothetical protein LSAT_V11C500259470 [Lactuca sativa]